MGATPLEAAAPRKNALATPDLSSPDIARIGSAVRPSAAAPTVQGSADPSTAASALDRLAIPARGRVKTIRPDIVGRLRTDDDCFERSRESVAIQSPQVGM